MNMRGQYGSASQGRTYIGAFLVHTLELKQRYNNVTPAAVQALLNELSSAGVAVASTAGTNRWEIALKEGTWVQLTWHPDYSGLEITITDRELRPVDQLGSKRLRYETLLHRLTPRLQSYGATTVGAAIVGQAGSIFGHTPGDVENELDQLHNEMMSFGQQLHASAKREEDQARTGVTKERDAELAAWKVVESFQPQVNEVYRIEKLLNEAGVDKKQTRLWLESIPPYADISMTPLGKNEGLKQQFIVAKASLDKAMSAAQRFAAIKRARELTDKRSALEHTRQGELPLSQWTQSTWDPFFTGWMKFHGEKKDIPLQTWPLSGTWDRTQDYRKQFVDLYNKAPFKPSGAAPLDPDRKDPSITGGLGDLLKIGKYALIGALGIGAAVALSSVVSNLRSGKDPGEKYMELIRERRPRASRSLPPRRPQLALPPGSATEDA